MRGYTRIRECGIANQIRKFQPPVAGLDQSRAVERFGIGPTGIRRPTGDLDRL